MLGVVLVARTRLLRLRLIHPNSPPIQLIPIALITSSQTQTPSDDLSHKPWAKSSRSHRQVTDIELERSSATPQCC